MENPYLWGFETVLGRQLIFFIDAEYTTRYYYKQFS